MTTHFTDGLVQGKALISGKQSTPTEVKIAYTHCSSAKGKDSGTVVLLHGYPETRYQFRHVIRPLAEAGFNVVAPDYRGAGDSSKPVSGYEKTKLAADIHELLFKHLDIKSKVHIVGHDIGGMVAYAYASRYPEHTASVAWGECPLPGTSAYDKIVVEETHGGLWHFIFHWQQDLPEALTQGRERLYIEHFYHRLTFRPDFLTISDIDHYESQFEASGAMRAGFELYRAFHKDADENRDWLEQKGKCEVPCLWIGGEHSLLTSIGEAQCEEVFTQVRTSTVGGSGHWVAEENPGVFTEQILSWVRENTSNQG